MFIFQSYYWGRLNAARKKLQLLKLTMKFKYCIKPHPRGDICDKHLTFDEDRKRMPRFFQLRNIHLLLPKSELAVIIHTALYCPD